MRRTKLTTLAAVLLATAIHAAPKAKSTAPVEPPDAVNSSIPRVHEFSGDDVSVVLRSLARQAGMNLVIDDRVSGTVTLRLEGKTPREAIETIAAANEMILDKKGDVFYVRLKNENAPVAKDRSLEDAIGAAYGPALSGALIKLHDTLVDHQARPETAQKIARSKKALFDAFLAEGFTREEALRLVLADQGTSPPNLRQ